MLRFGYTTLEKSILIGIDNQPMIDVKNHGYFIGTRTLAQCVSDYNLTQKQIKELMK